MKRALAAALLLALAAACSSGGDDSEAADTVAAVVETTTSTTRAPANPEEAFSDEFEALTGHAGSRAEAAITMARAMCDMLDTADSVSGGMADIGLALAFSEAEDGGVITENEMGQLVMLGTEHFCPEHEETVSDYVTSRTN